MHIKTRIMRMLQKKSGAKVSDITALSGVSRSYAHKMFQELRDEGKIVLIGRANQARYVLAKEDRVAQAKKALLKTHRFLVNRNLSEDAVLDKIKKETGIFLGIPRSAAHIAEYSFLEMLNNAIEHSASAAIEVIVEKSAHAIRFEVLDKGIGIFRHIMKKKRLRDEYEAIQDLTKGKLTTAPKAHSGEGIFFTSKLADILVIKSGNKQLIFNNLIGDIFVKDVQNAPGTKVIFSLDTGSKREMIKIFKKYTSEETLAFDKTRIKVELYTIDSEYLSRSQARRILAGLEKFKRIVLDFKGVKVVGQGFADEIFRVWKAQHPQTHISWENANPNVEFMLRRSGGQE